MEYRFEADGEAFCDPHNPHRTPGSFGERSVIEFPGYAPPGLAGGARPRPPPVELAPARAALVAARHRPAPPAPAARRPRRRRLRAPRPAAAADRPRDRDEPDPALPRRAARPAGRDEDYSASTRYARTLAATLPGLAPATAHAGLGASLGALALLHARWLHPGAFGALMLQSGSFFRQRWDRQESGFPRFRRISRFVGAVLHGGRAATPIPITLTCGAPEENLANNRAVATRAAPPGPRGHAARQPRRAQLRRLARHARPAPRRSARARLGVESPRDGAHAPDRPAARHRGGLVARVRDDGRRRRARDRARRRAARVHAPSG